MKAFAALVFPLVSTKHSLESQNPAADLYGVFPTDTHLWRLNLVQYQYLSNKVTQNLSKQGTPNHLGASWFVSNAQIHRQLVFPTFIKYFLTLARRTYGLKDPLIEHVGELNLNRL